MKTGRISMTWWQPRGVKRCRRQDRGCRLYLGMILAALWLVACDDPELQLSNAGEQAAGRIASAGLAAPPGGVVSAGEPSSAGTGTMGGNLGTAGRIAPGGRSGAAGQDNLGGRGGMSGAGGRLAGMAATAAGTPVAGHSGSAGSEAPPLG